MTMRVWAALVGTTLLVGGAAPGIAAEKLLKLRPYTFNCGAAGQECSGWRHSFAFIDPLLRGAELPRDAYIEVYSAAEIDARLEKIESEVVKILDDAFARAGRTADAMGPDELRRLRDDVAADVVVQLGRIMAEREAQTREWLRHQLKEELRAAGIGR